jgi:HPt (histidine-containing phosphotransfer) domain-containing protein
MNGASWDERIVLDTGHLRGFTGGDSDLEAQVLEIFRSSAPAYLSALEAADDAAWKGCAHKLKGAARGIGALRLSCLAERVEHDSAAPTDRALAERHFRELPERLQQLSEAITMRLKDIRDAEMIVHD